jgi:hypothetical protein
MKKTWFVALLALGVLGFVVPTRADTQWTLTAGTTVCAPTPCIGVTSNEGGTANGFFVIPASAGSDPLGVASSLGSNPFNIMTTDGGNNPHIIGFDYTNANSTATYTPGYGASGGPYYDYVAFTSDDGLHTASFILLQSGSTYDLAMTTGTYQISGHEIGDCSNVSNDSVLTACASGGTNDTRTVVSGALVSSTYNPGGGGNTGVPEPSTLLLSALGLGALALKRFYA